MRRAVGGCGHSSSFDPSEEPFVAKITWVDEARRGAEMTGRAFA